MSSIPVKPLSEVQIILSNYGIVQIWPYLGASKCWGYSVLRTLALVRFQTVCRKVDLLFEPHHEKTCLCHMQTTKADQHLCCVVRCLNSIEPILTKFQDSS